MIKRIIKKSFIVLTPFIIFLFNSCLGLSMDIQMNRDGSGRLTMTYRISSSLSGIGSMDGNELMPIIPVYRADWDRTIEKLPGVKLVSYSNRVNARESSVNVVLDFPNIQSLAALLDSSGETVTYSQNNLNMILINDNSQRYDNNLIALMRSFYDDYEFSINFSSQSNSLLTITDGGGNIINKPARAAVTSSGRRLSFSIGIMDLLEIPGGLGLSINW
ncbi:MAG: hypothetical protein FWC21_00550 [Treponema sp.]|nr:hypothetical protein [Treponema sp.]